MALWRGACVAGGRMQSACLRSLLSHSPSHSSSSSFSLLSPLSSTSFQLPNRSYSPKAKGITLVPNSSSPHLRAHASTAPLSRVGRYKKFFYIGAPPFPLEFGLSPLFSPSALQSHFHHHLNLTKKLNDILYYIHCGHPEQQIEYERLGKLPLDKLVEALAEDRQEAYIFNTASEVLAHDFFWKCLSPKSEKMNLSPALLDALDYQFGGLEGLQKKFTEEADKIDGSGWVWLLYVAGGDMVVISMRNADSPYGYGPGYTPLMVLDLWEHSYCADYGNDRDEYLRNYWKVINWDYVSKQYEKCVKED